MSHVTAVVSIRRCLAAFVPGTVSGVQPSPSPAQPSPAQLCGHQISNSSGAVTLLLLPDRQGAACNSSWGSVSMLSKLSSII